MSNIRVFTVLDEISELHNKVDDRFYQSPGLEVEYTDKEVQMFKKLCKKFLEALEEDENEPSKL